MSTRAGKLVLPAFIAVVAVIFVYFYRLGGGALPGDSSYTFQALVADASALTGGSEVREAGVKVGQVAQIGERNGTTVVIVRLDSRHAPIDRDARVAVRLKSLAGEHYLSVDPGHAAVGALPDGGILPLAANDPATQLDEILSALDRPTRLRLRTVLDEAGAGLRDNGAKLNATFGSLSRFVDDATPVTILLDRQRREVARLVDDLARVMRAFGDRRVAIRVLARQARRAAQAVASRDAAVARTLHELPATLDQVEGTAARLGTFSRRATPVLASLTVAVRRLTPVMRRLRPAATATHRMLGALARFEPQASPMLRRLRRFALVGSGTAPALDDVLAQADPLFVYLAPYKHELGALFADLKSATSTFDATGHLARVHLMAAPSMLAVHTAEEQRALRALLKVGGITPITRQGINPYPDPERAGRPVPFTRGYARVDALEER